MSQAADYDELSLAWHDSASNMDAATPNMPTISELRERFECELAAGWQLYVAVCDRSIIGMLAIKPSEAILDQIFVLTEARGRGIGSTLLKTAKSLMPNGFSLGMAAKNRKAVRFYESAGLSVIVEGKHTVSGLRVQYHGWNGT